MREIRLSITMIVILLIFVGIVMIYSASCIYALQELNDSMYFLRRHLMFLVIGSAMMLTAMTIDYRDLRKYAKPLLVIGIVLLVLVLIPHIGKASYGARRWFKLGPFFFQPSEFVKLAMLIYVADFLARKQTKITDFFRGFLPIVMVVGITCLLILKQPDLGSSVLIALIVFIMMFVAGARPAHILSLGLLALPVLFLLVARVPYRMKRIVAFLNPWEDSQGVGFQLTQSQIAFGSGGLFGVGPGHSMQKLYYLPAAHTDFILSIIGEELGFVGAFAVILLFVAFIWQGARIAKRTMDPFGYYLSTGIVGIIGLQAMVNVGVSIGALPTKGLPLPFISYGGSALVFNMVCVGLLLNISRIQDQSG
ncbi:MAG: putative lipid II flippase FtsW [Candidatus Omnitrophota bacterium]|nr:putative lipid II flippase FtsW [Candidatus Omnitrophota bacterium]MDZ4242367.1 putative lipid II flippase FtsW [Candidatus Omnitrophota bacterium]